MLCIVFQFTHPGKGATGEACTLYRRGRRFNSRTLGRVRLICIYLVSLLYRFNSRTLGRVRQGSGNNLGDINLRFNSRTLGRVRLELLLASRDASAVSIHAPWEGCDTTSGSISRGQWSFNSRTLGRVRRL